MTESRVCLLCGAEAYSALVFARDFNRQIDEADFYYLRCGNCGAIRLANPPDDPARYYGADYYGLPVDADALLRGSRFDYKLEIVQRFAASGRMLEVGPGAGGFAYLAKLAGFDVSVIEPGKSASRFISEQLGITVLDQSETLGGEQLGEFDVVALWHVLEHIDHVDAFLANVGQRVRRGGLLVLALPFLMPIEDVFSVSGRGTVVTGRVERGMVKVGEEVEIVGIRDTTKTVCTGVEMFRKILDQGQAGDNIGVLLRGTKRDEVERGQVVAKPGSITPHKRFKGGDVYIDEGGGRPTHAVFQWISAAVLLSDDGRDGVGGVAGGG